MVKTIASFRKWWENSQEEEEGLGEDTGKEKQGFSANRENGLEERELEAELVRAVARTSERNRLKVHH